ncbi:MMPL family transporter [Streptomyces longwoodensis]|uniref:MMPL family transporter n=1 Tax=Streptomyces longwoodensis TaxID=68231 RepID=UPI0033C7ED49
MFERLGRLVTRRAWWVIGFWTAAIAVLVPLSPGLTTSSGGSSDLPGRYESVRADAAAKRAFPENGGQTALFVVQRQDGAALTRADFTRAETLAEAVNAARVPDVAGARADASAVSDNGKVLPVGVGLAARTGTDQEAADRATKALRAVAARTVAGSDVTAELTGAPALTADAGEAISKAEVTLSVGTIVALILLLALIFRSPVAVVMPLLTVGLVYLAASALVGISSDVLGFEVGPFAPSLLVVILFGVGVDYTLFLLFRYRELMRHSDTADSTAAVAQSVRSVGEAVASSALVVISAFVALSFSDLASSAALAPTLVVSIAVMLLAGLTLVPAVMTVLGPRLFWLNRHWRRPARTDGPSARMARLLADRPRGSAVAATAVVVLLGLAGFGTRIDYDPNSGLPTSYASVTALEDFNAAFPAGAINPTQVILPDRVPTATAERLRGELEDADGVAQALPVQRGRDGTFEIDVVLDAAPYSSAALHTVADVVRPTAHRIAGPQALVGGTSAVTLDTRTATLRDLRVVYLIAALLIAVILGAVLRSVVAPIVVLVLVGLAFLGALGASVLVVQHVQGDPGVSSSIPLLLFLLVVALGSDYTIIMAARLREELHRRPGAEAVRTAARTTIPTIAAAGAVLAATFASLIVTGVTALSQIGLAVVTGILLVAFVVACWLLPATVRLLGHWFWWPRHPRQDAPAPDRAPAGRSPARQR